MAITITQPSPANVQTGAAGSIVLNLTAGGQPSGAGGSVALAASGGTAPYVWELLAGQVPDGCNWDGSGAIRGIPQLRGSALLLVRATDSATPQSFADAFVTVTVS